MNDSKVYSAKNVFEGLKKTFHQYLEAQYHIWDEGLILERQRLLNRSGVTFQEPHLEATPFYTSVKGFDHLEIPEAAKQILRLACTRKGTGIYSEPYTHQTLALEATLGRGEEIIVATGTGSGKTESFLMPILGSLAIESSARPSSWESPGMRALLLYPMNALVNDQLARLRRLFGDEEIAENLRKSGGRNATFGMYTSRTPYPGLNTPAKDRERIGTLLAHLFHGLSAEARALLKAEGKWPAKDIDLYSESLFKTDVNDAELFSRQEMQRACPDLLVTNYSMLEYMLLRPIERSMFEQTAKWLHRDPKNYFTVVLDEAHMYRGSGGAEVAYLLRRLHSRLGVDRHRIRYILTSASLGSGDEAARKIKKFAADLTGLESTTRGFTLITGTPEKKIGARLATSEESALLEAFDFGTLHSLHEAPKEAEASVRDLLAAFNVDLTAGPFTQAELQGAVSRWIESFGPAALAANLITAKPEQLNQVARLVFPVAKHPDRSMEALLALMSFARDNKSGRVFAPVRSHLFFRGLPGLYACVNPTCTERVQVDKKGVLGRLFSLPKLRCECGSRVYELLTHRDCGAAFIRGFIAGDQGDFLWHERSSGLWSDLQLMEVHLLVEPDRRSSRPGKAVTGLRCWLHKGTGRLVGSAPTAENADQYLAVLRPDSTVQERGRFILSFNKECPVCVRSWQGLSKIMDLATKGEAPFAHLVREQVALQPSTRVKSDRSPNGGRKSLLFSDGRQKAARLARDIPREIEHDVFRQLLLMAVQTLERLKHEPVLSRRIYIAFLDVLSRTGLQLFDGQDRHALQTGVSDYRKWHDGNLNDALSEFEVRPPPRFSAQLLRQLGSRFYSVNSLTLAYIEPTKGAFQALTSAIPELDSAELRSLAVVWLQGLANEFAFDPSIRQGIRQQAAGYTISAPTSRGFTPRQTAFLAARSGIAPSALVKVFADTLCSDDEQKRSFINPGRVRLTLALEKPWYQCLACTAVSPMSLWGHCPNCLVPAVTPVLPNETSYLRARKSFWRDPVARALSSDDAPLNLTVEEHTAQLSHRDVSDPSTTTEEYERRFRDILIRPGDSSIDVLSSTTTMEVGIDIGSLVAVGLRNIPPLRQNYQQRAGRAGRRGSAISTVLTYAQNSPHDNHYFSNPQQIIAGEPTMPGVDTRNSKIIQRHVRAQLIQAFFHAHGGAPATGDIFSMLGDTWDFYSNDGPFSLKAFERWLNTSAAAEQCFTDIKDWVPPGLSIDPKEVAAKLLATLDEQRPSTEEELDQADEYLIEFLFSHGHLPSYAFPRDLCALQIEGDPPREGRRRVPVIQRPQQGLNIALSEYAPGRLVVVNKKTYRVGTVASGGSSTLVNRAERLFAGRRLYVHCNACLFTSGFLQDSADGKSCPVCLTGQLLAVTVIQPEVVFPEGGREVDEFDDEQTYTQATSAQLPLPEGDAPFTWEPVHHKGQLATAHNQQMVMVNKGEDNGSDEGGFLVCSRCGKTSLDGQALGPHKRDYRIETKRGEPSPSQQCNGEMHRVFLGYAFSSDVLLFRVPVAKPFRFDPIDKRARQPMADGLQSLCEAIVLATSRVLDIDLREVNAGYRFVRHGTDNFADVFLYDTLSGGAGYATLAGKFFLRILDVADEIVQKCDCTSSCDKCLRHYGNRFHHASLDRHLASDLISFIKTGNPPKTFDASRQQLELNTLGQLLELAGWSTLQDPRAPLVMKRGSRTTSFWAIPSLLDPRSLGFNVDSETAVFTPYELSRDLPGAYAEVN